MAKDTTVNLVFDLKRLFADLTKRLDSLVERIDVPKKQDRLQEINHEIESPEFWNDQKRAGQLQKEKAALEKDVSQFEETSRAVNDSTELLEMVSDDEQALLELKVDAERLEKSVRAMEMQLMLGGQHDKNNAIMNINAGQGGVDSQDFAEMLLRMYRRYAERRGFEVEVVELQPGEEAGFKSATILVKGDYAYGYLKAEIGVHRLVRISPFDSNARRHTSFASVWVIPEIEDDIDIEIKPEDLRVDTYRAGGAGGQHVNKTDSAIRLTHLPTGTVVACQAERSQQKNRSTAMKLLRAKLYDLEMKKRLAERDKAEAQKMEASFGSQIRNYVLAPYRLAKDLRTDYEVGNVDAVLDGDIQPFIESYLLQQET